MNILLVNHYAGSPTLGMEYRPYYLAREWVRAGHRVQVLAADFSHVRTVQPKVGDAGIELTDGVAYRFYATPRYAGNGVARLKNIAAFLRAVWADTTRLVRDFKPDVVISMLPKVHGHMASRGLDLRPRQNALGPGCGLG